MQMIFQDPIDSLDPRMTVEDIIQEGLKIQKFRNRAENHKKACDVLEEVGLIADYCSRYPNEFSGGQRQRIGIARAIVMNPEFMICDEPISALDVSIRAQIINLLNDLKVNHGLTLMFIAHDLSIVRFISDRIGVIYKGDIVEIADGEELFNFPLHPYTKSLISAIPLPDPQIEKKKVLLTYDPSIHNYSEENKPHMVDIGHNHFVYGDDKEIAEYKRLRELGKPLDVIKISNNIDANSIVNNQITVSQEFLETPVHDTGAPLYGVLGFLLPVVGIIAALIFKKNKYYRNYTKLKKWSIIGFIVIGAIIVLFGLLLLLSLRKV